MTAPTPLGDALTAALYRTHVALELEHGIPGARAEAAAIEGLPDAVVAAMARGESSEAITAALEADA